MLLPPICSVQRRFFEVISKTHLRRTVSFKFVNKKLYNTDHPLKYDKIMSTKKKDEIIVAHLTSLHVLGCGSAGSSTALLVDCAKCTYLFNCSEGMQRIAGEYNQKLTKIKNIFITTPIWDRFGGLTGASLTMDNCGVEEVNIHAPEGTEEILEAVQNFVSYKALKIKKPDLTIDENGNKVYRDLNMIVEYVTLARKQEEAINTKDYVDLAIDDITYYDYKQKGMKRSVPWKSNVSKVRKFDLSKGRINTSLAFICKLHEKRGTLDVDKCLKLGIPPGPVLGVLKAGGSHTLPNGQIITSKDVCAESSPGPIFIVMDCYDEVSLESLMTNKSFDKYFIDNVKCESDIPKCIVHFTPENILKNPRYKEWMAKFGAKTEHLIINCENNSVSSMSCNTVQRQMHLVHPIVFPLLADENNEFPAEYDSPPREDNLIVYRTKLQDSFHLRPFKGFKRMKLHKDDLNEKVNLMYDITGFEELLQEFQTNLNEKIEALKPIMDYPKLTMLGTGSSMPSKSRNTSGMLLQINENISMIIDCGEGTLMQMIRLFGKAETYRLLSTVKGIYVSHLHADHQIGLIGILTERRKVNQQPVYLIVPEQLKAFLEFYDAKYEDIHDYQLISNDLFLKDKHALSQAEESKIFNNLGIKNINTCYVKHCPFSYGVAFTFKDNRTIVYSGDTMPCESLIELGIECDVLIHEATHEDGLESEAEYKKHSTFSQAVSVGKRMRAKNILLTHFSQRYAKLPRVTDLSDLSNVSFAYDNMQIKLDEFPLTSTFTPFLLVMFNDFWQKLQARAARRIQMKSA